MNKKFFFAIGILVLLVAGGVAFWVWHGMADAGAQPSRSTAVGQANGKPKNSNPRAKSPQKKAISVTAVPREKPVFVEDEEANFTSAEKEASRKLQDALDAEDLKGVCAACKIAAESPNAVLRQRALTALGWFGKDALPEMTPFLADGDEDIASDALQQWTGALAEVDDDALKASIVEAAMKILTDEDALDQISMELNSMPNAVALQVLINVIGGGNAEAAAKAKEAYEFITGDPYTDVNAANKWLVDNPDEN